MQRAVTPITTLVSLRLPVPEADVWQYKPGVRAQEGTTREVYCHHLEIPDHSICDLAF